MNKRTHSRSKQSRSRHSPVYGIALGGSLILSSVLAIASGGEAVQAGKGPSTLYAGTGGYAGADANVVVNRNGRNPGRNRVRNGLSAAAKRGRKVFNDKPCSVCHSTTSRKKVGPGLKGVVGRRSRDGVGRLTISRIRAYIKNPRAIKKNAQMIRIPLSKSEMNDLIAFLRTL